MSCKISKETLIDYAYNELPEKERAEFETHLAGCEACRSELAGLKSTSNLMQRWENERSGLHLKFVQPPVAIGQTIAALWTRIRRPVRGLAIGFAGLLLFLSLANFEASYSNGEFSMKMALFDRGTPSPEQPLPDQDLLAQPVSQGEFQRWQFQSYQLMSDLLLDSEKRQQAQLSATLSRFASEMDQQRREDLQLVGKGIEAYYWSNQSEIRQTNRALQHLMQVKMPEQASPSSIDSSDGNYEHQNQEK